MQTSRAFAEARNQALKAERQQFGAKSPRSNSELALRTQDFGRHTPRRSRAKRNLVWERIQLESHGLYAENLHLLAKRFPTLTPTELRITALAKAMLKNWQIAEKLCITEKTVENHRIRIRRKLGLVHENLQRHLIGT